jgi:hypothetical protein
MKYSTVLRLHEPDAAGALFLVCCKLCASTMFRFMIRYHSSHAHNNMVDCISACYKHNDSFSIPHTFIHGKIPSAAHCAGNQHTLPTHVCT